MRFSEQAPPGCHKAAPLPRRPSHCPRSETQTLTKYMAGTSSGAVADISFQKIPPGTCFRQPLTALFQNKRPCPLGQYLSAKARGPQVPPLPSPLRYLRPGQRPRPSFRNSSRGLLAPQFWTPAFSFVVPIAYLKRLQGRDADSIGQSKVSEFYQRTPTGGGRLRTSAPGMPQAPPGPDGLRTADALGPELLRNTLPATLSGQTWTS